MLKKIRFQISLLIFFSILSNLLLAQSQQKIPRQLKILSPAQTYWTAEIEKIIFREEPQRSEKLTVGVRIKFIKKTLIPVTPVSGCFFEGPSTDSSVSWSKIMSLRLSGIYYSKEEINFLDYEGPTPAFPPYDYQGFPVIGFFVTEDDLKKGSKEIWKWTSKYPLPLRDGTILASLAIYHQPPYHQKNECHPHADFQKSFKPKPAEPKEIFDLAITEIKLTKDLPPSFAVKIENLGGQDFNDEVYVNIAWNFAGRWENVVHQKLIGLKGHQLKEVEIALKDKEIKTYLEENRITIPGKQKVKASLWFSSALLEEKDPQDNNELSFDFYWDPPIYSLWTINFGFKGPDYPYSLTIDDQDNWLIGGNITSGQTTDVIIRKGDLKGHLLWEKSFDTGLTDEICLLEPLGDGTFLLGLRAFPSLSANLCSSIILRIDSNGQPLWQKRFFKEDRYIWIKKAIKTKDGYIYLIGNSDGLGIGHDDILIIKINLDGQVLWLKAFGTADGRDYLDETSKPILLFGNKISFLGSRLYSDQGKNWLKQLIVYSFDQAKEIMTAKEINIKPIGHSKIDFKLLALLANGDLVTSGHLIEKTRTVDFLGLIDSNNQLKWVKAFSWLEPSSIFVDQDGGILVGAGLLENALILNLRPQGEIMWGKWYGALTTESNRINIPISFTRTSKNTFLVLSQSNLFSVPEKHGDSLRKWDDTLLMHLDKSGEGSIFLSNYDLASGLKGPIDVKTAGIEFSLQSHLGDDLSTTSPQVKIAPVKSNLTWQGKIKYSW